MNALALREVSKYSTPEKKKYTVKKISMVAAKSSIPNVKGLFVMIELVKKFFRKKSARSQIISFTKGSKYYFFYN
jgi:hypothetical protein